MHGDRRVVANGTGKSQIAFATVNRHLADVRALQTPYHLEDADRAAAEAKQDMRCRFNLLGFPEEVVEFRSGNMGDAASFPEEQAVDIVATIAVQRAATTRLTAELPAHVVI